MSVWRYFKESLMPEGSDTSPPAWRADLLGRLEYRHSLRGWGKSYFGTVEVLLDEPTIIETDEEGNPL